MRGDCIEHRSETEDRVAQVDSSQNLAQCNPGTSAKADTEHKSAAVPRSTEFKVLYLFSGPKKTAGGFEDYCRELGFSCGCNDIEYDPNHDLLCQDFWNEVLERLDDYDAYLLSPPCSSFTMARTGKDAGPGPLRGLEGRDRHGLRHLSVEDKKKVKEGTLLSRRAHTQLRIEQLHVENHGYLSSLTGERTVHPCSCWMSRRVGRARWGRVSHV